MSQNSSCHATVATCRKVVSINLFYQHTGAVYSFAAPMIKFWFWYLTRLLLTTVLIGWDHSLGWLLELSAGRQASAHISVAA
jgi:hypothetical protein